MIAHTEIDIEIEIEIDIDIDMWWLRLVGSLKI